ncbi:FAD-dependent oxidoreductase [Chitinivorax sp. PXF-14]|uniref:FAD-dependent oxidoreductase n=1 Tax=Chitinivorax sp. PXF-14 TaxID=3230488 RepID=UPI003465FFF1
MSDTFRPFWLAQALALDDAPPAPPATGPLDVDVCIVGGGYTGLWTAIQAKQARPDWRIAVIERDICGAGASGRNGGCMLTWSTKFLSLLALFGESEAVRLVRASEQAVGDMADFCQRHGIDAEIRLGGAVYAASNAAQTGALDRVFSALSQHGINRWRALTSAECLRQSGSARLSGGAASDAAGTLQPARLVRGLRRVAQQLGIGIYEHTPMLTLQAGQPSLVTTPQARIEARQVVLAINASMATAFPQFARSIVLVSSDMVVTAPQPAVIEALGLGRGQAVCDLRTFVHYWRSTPDGRLMLGKGGNDIPFGNRLRPGFDQPSRHRGQLARALRHFFPALSDTPIDASWNGASDRSATGFPFFGRLTGPGQVHYGFGYSGNGVVQSYLGGQILSSLLLGRDDAWTRSGLARGPLALFPPEPLRWCGATLVRNAIRRKEIAEDEGRPPARLDRYLSRYASMAAKAD